MLTIGNIYHIIGGELKDAHNSETNELDDFETIYKFVKNKKTAYFSPNKEIALIITKDNIANKQEILNFHLFKPL